MTNATKCGILAQMNIGALVKKIRDRNHWSQAQMATALHVSCPTISLYEHNKRRPRDVGTFLRLFSLANEEEQLTLREWAKHNKGRRGTRSDTGMDRL